LVWALAASSAWALGGAGCAGEGGGARPPDPLSPPPGGCSGLTRALARYQDRERVLCGPGEGTFRDLVPLGEGHLLALNRLTRVVELWQIAHAGAGGAAMPGTATTTTAVEGPFTSRVWSAATSSSLIVGLGGDRALSYEPVHGNWHLWAVNRLARSWADPLPDRIATGRWPIIKAGRDLVALDDSHLLDREPATGAFRVWLFDRDNERSVPFRATSFGGTREIFQRGHELTPLGAGRLLEWVPAAGEFRVWSFALGEETPAPTADRVIDPFAAVPATAGSWPGLGRNHELFLAAGDRLLTWDRDTGEIEVRALDPTAPDPGAGALIGRSTHERLRSLPRGWEPPTWSPALRRVVIALQRGRSFDHHFGRYCRAAAGSAPSCTAGPACCEAMPHSIPGAPACWQVDPERDDHVPNDRADCMNDKVNGGSMDRFAASTLAGCGDPRDFACVAPDAAGSLATYHRLAEQGALADRFFQSVIGFGDADPNEVNAIYFGRGGFGGAIPAEAGGSAITSLLAEALVPWALYLGDPERDTFGIAPPEFYDPRWPHLRRIEDLERDVALERLAPISVVVLPDALSELPGAGPPARGVERVAELVGLIESSRYADETLVLLAYLSAGGFFDHVAPPGPVDRRFDTSGLPYGPRVPLLATGRLARVNHVSHVPLELASLTRLLEWNWLGGETGQFSGRDVVANDICDLLVPTVVPCGPRAP
jgi:hypothetical protein